MPIPRFQPTHFQETIAAPTTNPSSTETRANATTGTGTATGGAGANTGAGITREKTAQEIEADRLFEEAMEEEYAKREGGA